MAQAASGTGTRFSYLLPRLADAEMRTEPFDHLYIPDLFDAADFAEITNAPEIRLPLADSDQELLDHLADAGYKHINFPGTTATLRDYLEWHRQGRHAKHDNYDTCEGFGVTMRLRSPPGVLAELDRFFSSDEFLEAATKRFGVPLPEVRWEGGIQKYLDGYEISPHPDIRAKALTYMVNINPGAGSEDMPIHTHYMTFRPPWRFLATFWEGNPGMERCWVPWDWCETAWRQTANNSMVMFRPGNSTMHAVKATYDHLPAQRTQIYGNLWFRQPPHPTLTNWSVFVIAGQPMRRAHRPSLAATLKRAAGRAWDLVRPK